MLIPVGLKINQLSLIKIITMMKLFLSFCSGSLAYLTAATHGLAEECQEIKDTFDLDPEAVSKFIIHCNKLLIFFVVFFCFKIL